MAVVFLAQLHGCALISSAKDESGSVLNPNKIHFAYDHQNPAYAARIIPVSDYYAALNLAKSRYQESAEKPLRVVSVAHAGSAEIENYVSEGIGLVDAYCYRWFQQLDDMGRLLAYQKQNVNVVTQLGTALLGVGGASSAFVASYGAATTAYAGASENFSSAFLVAPTSSKVKDRILAIMKTAATSLRTDAKKINFKQAYSRLEQYADLCTHSRAKEIVDAALDQTKSRIDGNNQLITSPR